jgi:hypothetical protein
MRPETREAMENLFRAKWNVPIAADYCNLTNKECKIIFDEYCRLNPPTYLQESSSNVLVLSHSDDVTDEFRN